MAKGLLGGMTDYSHQSLSDILNDLEQEQKRTISFKDAIQKHIITLEANKYWKEVVPSHFRDCVYYALRHYNTSIEEFEDIRKDLLLEVKEHHVKRLEKISKVAQEINVDIGKIWHREYDNKNYGNPNFRFVEDIYGDTRDMAVNLLDISNIAERLRDFVGKKSIVQPETDKEGKKGNKFLSMLKSGWGIGAILAILVILLGNNWIFRLWDYYHSNKPNKMEKVRTIDQQTELATDKTLSKFKLPYLESVPILNKGLFVKYYFNDFILGGANIDNVSYNARGKDGSRLKINKEKNEIITGITQEPYIEIGFNGDFYSIEVTGQHYTFNAVLTKITKPTLSLINYDKIHNE